MAFWGGKIFAHKDYQPPNGDLAYSTWFWKCLNPACEGECMRRKVVGIHATKRHGALEPIAFLHAWSLVPPTAAKRHIKEEPTNAAIDALITDPANLAEYRRVCVHFGLPLH